MKLFSTFFFPFFLLALTLGRASAQSVLPWQDVPETTIALPAGAEVALSVSNYRTFELDLNALRTALRAAPAEGGAAARTQACFIELPVPDGGAMRFRVEDSPVMHPGLAARYPDIKSYSIYTEGMHKWQGRLAVSPLGVHAVFHSPGGEVFIDPFATEQNRYHVAYYTKNVVADENTARALSCGYQGLPHDHDPLEGISPGHEAPQPQGRGFGPVSLRVYDLALACTGEYGQAKGGTVAAVMATFNTAINRLNAIFEPEVAVRMMLIENNDNLIWLDPMTDPYTNANVGGDLLDQNTNVIVQNGGIAFNAFDVGHVFTMGCTDVGGVAGGTVCSNGKARGVTCHYTSNIDAIVRRVMAHEIAHQFATAHSWSNCPGILGQLASGWAYEPGSGSTIMSYAGSCGSENVQGDSDIYYHAGSLTQFIGYSRQEFGSTCPTVVPTDNNEPVITWPYVNGFYIPISTPFELRATAEDPDGDNLTYCWEQYDLGPISVLGDPIGDGPAFRSFPPTPNNHRYFPRINNIIAGTSDVREVLPDYSRALNFRFTVRDNQMGGGGTVWETVSFRATDSAGPFRVTSPNISSVAWQGGDYVEVTWDVANTDNELVNCQLVNIRLSTDGGFTYPITLLSGAPNNGSAYVTVPQLTTAQARIRVEAANNVFFDISNANFSIQPRTAPTYTLSYGPVFQQLCLPASAEVVFETASLLGYDSLVALSVVGGLPAGATAGFSVDTIAPGESSLLSLDFSAVNFDGDVEILVRAVAPSLDTFYRTVYFELIDNDFSELALAEPPMGEAGITLSTDFSWIPTLNANTYDFELATSPAFGGSVIEDAQGLTETSYSPSTLLEENTLFYWRVRPLNECGPGNWLDPFVFHTINAVCEPATAEDVPIVIPGTGQPPTRQSQLFVPFSGTISDINLPVIDVRFTPVRYLEISLISPAGTEVLLFDENCGNTNRVFIGFDDDAPNDIICAPDDGIVFKPVSPLAAFIGENTAGVWTLKVRAVQTGFGTAGSITSWGLEFCANSTPNAPIIITNEPLFVPPAEGNPITRDLLAAEDPDNGPADLQFTVVRPPAHGALYLINDQLSSGSAFRQSTIDANNLYYVHDGSATTADDFTFVVEDGTGGFLPVERFDITIDEGAVVGTDDPIAAPARFVLHPNPATDWVRLKSDAPFTTDTPVRIFNVHGQLMSRRVLPQGSQEWMFSAAQWAAGIYFVQLGDQVERLVIQR